MCGTLTAGLMVNQGMPMVLAIAVGLLLGTLAGFLNGLIIATFKVPAFIVTMSMMNVAKGVAYIYPAAVLSAFPTTCLPESEQESCSASCRSRLCT